MVLPCRGLVALGRQPSLVHSVYCSDQKRFETGGVALDVPAGYLHLGFIVISVPNLALIAAMIGMFVIALLAPFPREGSGGTGDGK